MAAQIQIQLSAAGKPPTEVRLFRAGKNATLKGTFLWTDRSVELVKQQWAKLGRDFGFDYEHGSLDPSVAPKDREAAGWGRIDPRPDGLWVTGIQWTGPALEKIAAKAFRYLSPTPQIDTASGEIVGCLNCALTNLPATLNAAPLVLSERPSPPRNGFTSTRLNAMDPKTKKDMYAACSALLAACQAGAESEDPQIKEMATALSEMLAPAISKLQEMGATDGGEPVSMAALNAVYETAQKVTGQADGLVGALLALSAQATQKVAVKKDAEKDERAQLFAQILSAKKAHPSDKDSFLKLSVADLRSYLKVAPALLPEGEEPAVAAAPLSASPSAPASEAPEADALLSLVRVG